MPTLAGLFAPLLAVSTCPELGAHSALVAPHALTTDVLDQVRRAHVRRHECLGLRTMKCIAAVLMGPHGGCPALTPRSC
jgi:hypothetical protein